MNAPQRQRSLDEIAHQASNEALSISMGVHMLSAVPESVLTAHQIRALKLMQASTKSLIELMDQLKCTKESMMSHETWRHE